MMIITRSITKATIINYVRADSEPESEPPTLINLTCTLHSVTSFIIIVTSRDTSHSLESHYLNTANQLKLSMFVETNGKERGNHKILNVH